MDQNRRIMVAPVNKVVGVEGNCTFNRALHALPGANGPRWIFQYARETETERSTVSIPKNSNTMSATEVSRMIVLTAACGLIRHLALALALTASFAATAAFPPLAKLTPVAAAPAPALELKDTAGKLHRLADYRGKVVLVNFWATWCEPCRDEMPSMQRLKDRMEKEPGAPLVILAVNHGRMPRRR